MQKPRQEGAWNYFLGRFDSPWGTTVERKKGVLGLWEINNPELKWWEKKL